MANNAVSNEPDGPLRGNSNNSVVQISSRVLGQTGQPAGPVDRQELLSRGLSASQVDAIDVQRHQQEVLQQHIQNWMMVFLCMVCILFPVLLGLLIWLLISWNKARAEEARCDAPLIDWVSVVVAAKCYHVFLHKAVLLFVCKFDQRQAQELRIAPPLRVRIYNFIFPLFDFVWNIVGIALALGSSDCKRTMPQLYNSIVAFASVAVFFTAFMVINTIGLQAIAVYMMRHGMLRTTMAAPAGTLESISIVKHTEVSGDPSCSVCLEEFDAKKEIRKTKCGHYFHTDCVKGWLNVNHTCPLCRADLSGAGDDAAQLGAAQDGQDIILDSRDPEP